MTAWTYGLWAFAAGVLIPAMAILNGGLGRVLGSPGWAAVILFATALVASLAVAAFSGAPALAALANARPEQFAAGLIVAFYVLSATYLTPRFGVAPTILLVVVAQIFAASLIGHFGWLGAPRQPIGLLRGAGVAMMVGGVILTQLRPSH
ncbi:MAG TPA: DMT family transporter [Phenylobacterium sp.]|jgi:transporter family-2 protein|nr:DMT family transporter [Phenylobacterium sp.]